MFIPVPCLTKGNAKKIPQGIHVFVEISSCIPQALKDEVPKKSCTCEMDLETIWTFSDWPVIKKVC